MMKSKLRIVFLVVLFSSMLYCQAVPRALASVRARMVGSPAQVSKTIPFEYVEVDAQVAGDCKLVGDIDGDGFPDLVVGGMPHEQLNWYRYPDWQKTVIATPNNEFTTDCAFGDVDSDGDLDIVVPDGDSGLNLVWFENPRPSGDPFSGASWQRRDVGEIGSWGKDVELSDFDGNGLLDVATRRDTEAMIFFQNSANSWQKMTFSGVDMGIEGMASGDVDGDGDLDLILHGVWLRNPGGAAAQTPTSWDQFDIGAAPDEFKALVADMNQDGNADVLFSSSESTADVVWWSADNGDPTGPWTRHLVLPSVERAHTLQAADMDLDGDMDLVVGQMHTSAANEIMVMQNVDGQATTWEKQVLGTGGLHNGVVADIGNDGDYDIFGANWTGNPPVRLWINQVAELGSWTYLPISTNHTQTFGLAFGDMNADGRQDIVSGPYWYSNPGGDMSGVWAQAAFPDGMQAALTLDVDGDANADVIAQKDEGEIGLYWLEWSGNNAWNSVRIGAVDQASHSLGAQGYRLADLEAGGRAEVVFSSGAGIYYFRIPADPTAGNWPRVHVSANPSDEGFAAGDMDGDGDLDIAATTGDSKRVEWYRNPGDGSAEWAPFHVGDFGDAVYPDRTEVADLNGDGRLDIIVTEENGGESDAQTYWWEAPADPTAQNWTRYLIADQGTTNSMDVADMDGDGDPDVILAEHRGAKKLSIWLNDSLGNFTEAVVDRGKESHLGARTVDLDGDGDLDIVSIAWDAFQNVHLWRNDRVSTSGATPTPPPGATATPVPPTPTPVPTAPVSGGSGRVGDGLLVLYTFNEGDGQTVFDVSGLAPQLNLSIDDMQAVTWLDGGGLRVNSPTILLSAAPAQKVIDGSRATGEISLEVWVRPAGTNQEGPARVLSCSKDHFQRNFTLGQEYSQYDVRLRTTTTDPNGVPSLTSDQGAVSESLTHVVYTRSADGLAHLYINGGESTGSPVSGELVNWVDGYSLMLANEQTMERPWLGDYRLAAIYDRALSFEEVQQNYQAGPVTPQPAPSVWRFLPWVARLRTSMQPADQPNLAPVAAQPALSPTPTVELLSIPQTGGAPAEQVATPFGSMNVRQVLAIGLIGIIVLFGLLALSVRIRSQGSDRL